MVLAVQAGGSPIVVPLVITGSLLLGLGSPDRATATSLTKTKRCPISVATSDPPPGLIAGSHFYSNGRLWVAFPRRGGIIFSRRYGDASVRSDGSIAVKVAWYRGVAGRLRISARRIDGPTGRLRARVPQGYGQSGFQSTAIIFPKSGCWRVTGTVGSVTLRFVLLVVP
jgi:hypothetical protein